MNLMKRTLISIFVSFTILVGEVFASSSSEELASVSVEKNIEQENKTSECHSNYSAIVIDDSNHHIIYEHEADKIIYPASLTKVMTIYLAFEEIEKGRLKLSDKIRVSGYAQDISAINKITTLKVREGESITVKDAIKGAAIKSFNEAAVLLAEKIAGNEWYFAKLMNKKAKELNMKYTNFRNASGLHEPGQYSTTYDLARLLIAIRRDFPNKCKYFSEKKLVCKDKTFVTHNFFLRDYEGATGFKTGYTSIAGYNLMATATRDGKSLTAVIVACDRSDRRNKYMAEIFDKAFEVAGREGGEIEVKLVVK